MSHRIDPFSHGSFRPGGPFTLYWISENEVQIDLESSFTETKNFDSFEFSVRAFVTGNGRTLRTAFLRRAAIVSVQDCGAEDKVEISRWSPVEIKTTLAIQRLAIAKSNQNTSKNV